MKPSREPNRLPLLKRIDVPLGEMAWMEKAKKIKSPCVRSKHGHRHLAALGSVIFTSYRYSHAPHHRYRYGIPVDIAMLGSNYTYLSTNTTRVTLPSPCSWWLSLLWILVWHWTRLEILIEAPSLMNACPPTFTLVANHWFGRKKKGCLSFFDLVSLGD